MSDTKRSATAFGSMLVAALSLGACEPAPTNPLPTPEMAVALSPGHIATGDVMNQGGAGVYAHDAVRVVRQPHGVLLTMSVPTPESGTYLYPEGFTPGAPEVFTVWAFIFNFPDLCNGPCDGDDLGEEAAAKGSVYNVGGHVSGGGRLTISGRIAVGEPAVGPPSATPTPLVNPLTSEIHMALAPHGMLDPTTLPGEFRRPSGSPVCGCWWVGFIKP